MKELNYDHLKLDNFFSFRSDLAINRKEIRKLTEENKENDGSFNGLSNMFSGRGKHSTFGNGIQSVNRIALSKITNQSRTTSQVSPTKTTKTCKQPKKDERIKPGSKPDQFLTITTDINTQPRKSGYVDGSGERIPLSNITNQNDAEVFTRERCKPAENPRKVVASKMQRRITPTMDSISTELSFEDDLIHNDYDSAEFSTISDLQADEGDMFWNDEYEFAEVERLDAEENETEHNADGYHDEIPYVDSNTQSKKKRKRITMKEYYSYKLQVTKDEGLHLEQLLDDIKKKNYFGTCLGVMYVVEFQKRAVKSLMIHGPCGLQNTKSPCMDKFKCTKHFPKKYCSETYFDRSGHDRATVEITSHKQKKEVEDEEAVEEINAYFDGRYICASEASYRIFGFPIHHRSISVLRLSFQLPGEKSCTFTENETLEKVVRREKFKHSQLESFFILNRSDPNARQYTYDQIPKHYVWNETDRIWTMRKKGKQIGRLLYTHHSAGELWYLCFLLSNIQGPTSFEALKTITGVQYRNFKDACKNYELLDDDNEWHSVIEDCTKSGFPNQIR
ncbi:hypothetical protein POM88_000715 [Heracleum sosnowskyi]|uniref:Uncharacterized protein n=1 Tax=Heracleum sosnowskyi TaxID=360622 RepID=A0AAD8JET0_9APIA|nr:hypothetical protein POM88_000715 [Heracleum sosnowskyi]